MGARIAQLPVNICGVLRMLREFVIDSAAGYPSPARC